jgi:hypothetical protein
MRSSLTFLTRLSILTTALGLVALPAHAGVPKEVSLKVDSDLADGSQLKFEFKAKRGQVEYKVEAEGFAPAASGEYVLVLRGASEDREVARFSIETECGGSEGDEADTETDDGDDDAEDDGQDEECEDAGEWKGEVKLPEDWRLFALTAESLILYDGELAVADEVIERKSSRVKFQSRSLFQVDLGGNGESAKLTVQAECARPGAEIIFRLSGPESFFDVPLTLDRRGRGKASVREDGSLLANALDWNEVIILEGEIEIARQPLECK